jgi:formylglycine-generating enzyme required for sulfatase activity
MEDPELYIRKSPFFKMDRVKAPVLIFHGTADTNVPPAQSWSYFRALQYYGKVPVKFVVFPGEPHGPRKLTHQMRKVEEEVAWFDKYFFKTAKPENEALKKDSPLAARLKLNNVTMAQIPEVVKRGDLEVARFEVTYFQFFPFLQAEAEGNAKPDVHGKKPYTMLETGQYFQTHFNYPAHPKSLEEAKSYAKWLSDKTGQEWRIPYEDEVKDLYANHDGENTLDYWAGYAPNPEDAALLREKAKELKGTAPLLKEVGSFRGQGKDDEEPIYDLGGNVAEWVLTRDGKGKVIGGSADCPADPKSNCTPAPEYIGFRVVRGPAKPAPATASATP